MTWHDLREWAWAMCGTSGVFSIMTAGGYRIQGVGNTVLYSEHNLQQVSLTDSGSKRVRRTVPSSGLLPNDIVLVGGGGKKTSHSWQFGETSGYHLEHSVLYAYIYMYICTALIEPFDEETLLQNTDWASLDTMFTVQYSEHIARTSTSKGHLWHHVILFSVAILMKFLSKAFTHCPKGTLYWYQNCWAETEFDHAWSWLSSQLLAVRLE